MSLIAPISAWFRRLKRDARGVAALEFALALPLLLLLSLGCIELSRYILLHSKVEKTAYTMADLITQTEAVDMSNAEIEQLMAAAGEVMSPFSFEAEGVVIVSCVSKSGSNQPTINWQRSGGGSGSGASEIGTSGGVANLPDGFTMADRENLIVAEVFYRYTPMFGEEYVEGETIRKVAYFKPRLGALSSPPT